MSLTLCDVGPRDGLQSEADAMEPATRARLVNRLAAAGLPRVEAVSFVRSERVPHMAGAEEVVAAIEPLSGTEYSGLVLNAKGYERFAATGLDRVNVTLGATESFNQRNGEMSRDEALAQVEAVLAAATVPATATISVAFGCPFEGEVDEGEVVALAERLGADEVVLADTIGVATPSQVRRLVERVRGLGKPTGFHGHNTRNTGYANALAAIEAGADVLDASMGGIGGCPFAPNATGNIATEDLVYLLERSGIPTGLDLSALQDGAIWVGEQLGKQVPGLLSRAGTFPTS